MNKDSIIEILENNKFVYDEKFKEYYFIYDSNICAKFLGTTSYPVFNISNANNCLEVPIEDIKELSFIILNTFKSLHIKIRAEQETYISVMFPINGTTFNYYKVPSDLRAIRYELNKIDFKLKNMIDDFLNPHEYE